jgi:hypothetical protein
MARNRCTGGWSGAIYQSVTPIERNDTSGLANNHFDSVYRLLSNCK